MKEFMNETIRACIVVILIHSTLTHLNGMFDLKLIDLKIIPFRNK
jgi:hypothetical protein